MTSTIDNVQLIGDSFNITNKPLADILQDFDVALSGNVTSAGLDAFLAGLSVIVYLDGEDFNLSPLRGIEGVEFVGNAKELATVIRGNKKSPKGSIR